MTREIIAVQQGATYRIELNRPDGNVVHQDDPEFPDGRKERFRFDLGT